LAVEKISAGKEFMFDIPKDGGVEVPMYTPKIVRLPKLIKEYRQELRDTSGLGMEFHLRKKPKLEVSEEKNYGQELFKTPDVSKDLDIYQENHVFSGDQVTASTQPLGSIQVSVVTQTGASSQTLAATNTLAELQALMATNSHADKETPAEMVDSETRTTKDLEIESNILGAIKDSNIEPDSAQATFVGRGTEIQEQAKEKDAATEADQAGGKRMARLDRSSQETDRNENNSKTQ
jgi:hypothetical protein